MYSGVVRRNDYAIAPYYVMSDYKRVVPFSDSSFVYKACGVITLNEYCDISYESLCKMLYGKFYELYESKWLLAFYFIIHTETDSRHLHYILHFRSQIRVTTICNKLSQFLNVNPSVISVDKCLDFSMMLRYFLHWDAESVKNQKQRYEIIDLFSNMSENEITSLMAINDDRDISIEYLIEICSMSKSIVDVMFRLGLKTYHKFRYEIRDIYDYAQMHSDDYINEVNEKKEVPF